MNQSTANTARLKRQVTQLSNRLNNVNITRRRRRRGRRGATRATIMPGGVKIVDTEVLGLPAIPSGKSASFMVMSFCPGNTKLVRLDNEAGKFKRWSLIRVNIVYQPTASLSDSGSITYGILPGPKSALIDEESEILKLRPFQKHSLWKASSITVSGSIMIQPHMLTNGEKEDNVGFCLYISTTKPEVGCFRISYDLILNYPNP